MNDTQKKGRVTIPTDLDVVPETLEILKKWGADAIRDCDGTDFPQQLRDADAKIYSTYYTTRKDNASGYDKDTAFFDCIYLQDGTAGINAFPVAGDFKIGDKVRITGTTSSYQGERQIAVTDIEKIGEGTAPAPKSITAAQLNDGSVLGNLVTLRGTVVSFEESNGLVQTILVRDSAGGIGRVFIDGYITTGRDVQNLAVGREITVTGLASYDNTFNAPEGPFPRIRVRDRADIVCGEGGTTTVITGHEGPRHDVEEELPFN